MSADTMVPIPDKTQSFSRYSYVDGNPVGYADYSGHWKVKGTWSKFVNNVANPTKNYVTEADNWKKIGRGAAYATAGTVMGGPIGGVNGFLAGYNDIYSHNLKGAGAFLVDSTWSLPNTAAGLVYMGYLKASGAEFESGYSKQSNAFIFSNAKLNSPGLAIGNTVGVVYTSNEDGFKTTLRHELAHTWQYRIGGVFTSLKLAQEQFTGPKGTMRFMST